MPVVTGKSNLYGDYIAGTAGLDPEFARGRLIVITDTIANGATDSALSKYKLADVPSHAILSELTAFDVENWGFAQVVIGTETDTDALLDVARAAATTQKPIVFGDTHHGKHLWEVLGLAADPGGNISIWAHAEAAATGAGSMPFQIAYYAR